jgi:hypothetical protein
VLDHFASVLTKSQAKKHQFSTMIKDESLDRSESIVKTIDLCLKQRPSPQQKQIAQISLKILEAQDRYKDCPNPPLIRPNQ